MSETTHKVYEAVSNCMADLAEVGIGKNQRNKDQGFAYRGIDDVYDALGRILAKNKLLILPSVQRRIVDERPVEHRMTRSKSIMHHIILEVNYRFVSADDGSSFDVLFQGEALDMGDKGTSKALSMAYKYMALEIFCIPIEGMADGDSVTAPEAVVDHAPPPPAPRVEQSQTTRPAKSTPAKEHDEVIGDDLSVSDEEITTLRAAIQDADDRGDDAALTNMGRALLRLTFADEKLKREIALDIATARANHLTQDSRDNFEKMVRAYRAQTLISEKDKNALLKAAEELQ